MEPKGATGGVGEGQTSPPRRRRNDPSDFGQEIAPTMMEANLREAARPAKVGRPFRRENL
jgi:hypothetical protein